MLYSVVLTKNAQKGYYSLQDYLPRFNHLFELLALNPYPFQEFDLVKLKGLDNAYRVRIGRTRIQYQVREPERVILVYYVGLREGAYD